nr:putative reverse transcriptase domain-containing protein [Tanacetum cinerariifolium]
MPISINCYMLAVQTPNQHPDSNPNTAINAKRARHANAGNDARGSGPVRGQDATHIVGKFTFTGFMKCNPTAFHVTEEIVKFDAYIRGLTDNIKGEVTSSKPANLNKTNNKKQGNARDMVTTPTNGKVSSGSLHLCEHCFACHVGPCTIKCHKCRKVRHKARNRCPKKVKKEEVGEVRGQAYAIKDVEPQGLNVVTGRGGNEPSRTSFVDTRFSSMLNIDLVKIRASYEVELPDGRVVCMNTVLKGCTLNLVNHIFEIDLILIELGTFDVIISMDWLVKHDAVIVFGEKVVRISYENKTFIVKSDKGVSRLKVISCIKARKYVKQSCHLFLAHVTEKKSKEKQLEDVPIIRDFPEVFPNDFPGLPLPRPVEFRIDLVPEDAPVAHEPYRLGPSEMRELSVQLQDLLEKGFIHPSSSPWGASVLFVKKKDRSICDQDITSYALKKRTFQLQDLELDSVQFLGYVIDLSGVHVDPAKIEAIKNWAAPTTPVEVRQFLRLAGYYRRSKPRWVAATTEDSSLEVGKDYYGFVSGLPRMPSGYDTIWVIVVQLTKSAHFPPIKKRDSMEKLMQLFWRSLQEALRTKLDMSITYHPQTDGQSERIIQTLEYMLRACVIDFRSSWDRHFPLVKFHTKKAITRALRLHHMRLCMDERLDHRPFKILARVGPVAYTLELLEELKGIHRTFHVSNLKKCLAEGDIVVLMDEIQLDDKLHMIEEPVEVVDRERSRDLRKVGYL